MLRRWREFVTTRAHNVAAKWRAKGAGRVVPEEDEAEQYEPIGPSGVRVPVWVSEELDEQMEQLNQDRPEPACLPDSQGAVDNGTSLRLKVEPLKSVIKHSQSSGAFFSGGEDSDVKTSCPQLWLSSPSSSSMPTFTELPSYPISHQQSRLSCHEGAVDSGTFLRLKVSSQTSAIKHSQSSGAALGVLDSGAEVAPRLSSQRLSALTLQTSTTSWSSAASRSCDDLGLQQTLWSEDSLVWPVAEDGEQADAEAITGARSFNISVDGLWRLAPTQDEEKHCPKSMRELFIRKTRFTDMKGRTYRMQAISEDAFLFKRHRRPCIITLLDPDHLAISGKRSATLTYERAPEATQSFLEVIPVQSPS